jgi:hypothetical protein
VLAKIAALIAHEAHARFVAPVTAEYRKLNAAPECERAHLSDRSYDVESTTGAHIERAGQHDHDAKPPITATARPPFGFRA